MALSTFTTLCKQHPYLVPELSVSPERNLSHTMLMWPLPHAVNMTGLPTVCDAAPSILCDKALPRWTDVAPPTVRDTTPLILWDVTPPTLFGHGPSHNMEAYPFFAL